ncbi:hypothetical protein [Flagellimonas nanhaiensis]|uniref:Lipocalin-like domain-containing protein n=1 Tax=Flagellimonas nanhaiensis TaxID=2292706 RepID=A0A371JTM6_9FLAO|nr:hypothetical protein [Allomuricauda nanhaiensis]RDY61154.1 hypothetical protein DX873_03005 [Allomuricauda nanhaiensis]
MKKIFGLVLLLLVLISATEQTSHKPENMHSIEGTWELQSFYNYDDGINISDTVAKAEGYRQVKMYYNGKIMWSRHSPQDSLEWFGYGRYRITSDSLIETLEYGSTSMMRALDTLRVFTFELELTDETYSQISFDEEGNRTFSENYKRID